MSLKVLMLVPNLRVSNGVASYAMNYFRVLDCKKIQMDFALYYDVQSPYYNEIKNAGSKCYILPSVRKPLAHIKACDKILKEGKYDIVHDNTLLISVPMMKNAERNKVLVRLLHSHSAGLGETMQKARRNKLFLPLLKRYVTDNAACSDAAAKVMFGDESYNLIPNIVSDENLIYSETKRAEVRRKMNVDDKIVIGTVGRMSPPKNPLFALDVIKEIINKGQPIEYWWIGSGTMDEEFMKRVSDFGLEKQVRFLGSREDVVDLYQAMDIFFMPSRFEGLGIAAVEAQAMGLPCIVSDAIPIEADYTELIKRMPLNAPIDNWACGIIKCIETLEERQSRSDDLHNSMFSQNKAADRLTKQYFRMLEKNEKQ